MIRLTGVTQHYGLRPILKDLNLEVARGELVAVMGPNGTGKSTLLKVMAGVLSPQRGRVEIDGKVRRYSVEEENEIRRMTVYLPDHPWLPMARTGREFMLAVGALYVEDQERVMDHSIRLLKLFNLDHQADARIGTYSNGQQKKLAIAATLVTDAKVYLLDEPFTGGLDPAGVAVLKRLLKHLSERDDITVVLATQISDIAMALAQRIALIKDGRIGMIDTVERIIVSQSGAAGLEDAIERYLNPEAIRRIEEYIGEEHE